MGKKDFCCAVGCSHERKRAPCNFYELPVDEPWRTRWINAISRVSVLPSGRKSKWTPSKKTKLCSCHFVCPPNPKSRRKDSKHVVPTIFAHSKTKASEPIRRTSKSTNRSSIKVVKKENLKDVNPVSDKHLLNSTKQTNEEPIIVDTNNDEQEDAPLQSQHLQDHDYDLPTERAGKLADTLDELSRYFPEFMSDIQDSHRKAEMYDKVMSSGQVITLENSKHNNNLFQYRTGLPSYAVFSALFKYVEDKASDMKYPKGGKTNEHQHFVKRFSKKPGKMRKLTLEEEFFITLVRLRLGIPSKLCSSLFNVSEATFSNTFKAWCSLLSIELRLICEMPSASKIKEIQPDCFRDFDCVRIVVDCTELFSETPSSLEAHKQFHSQYKHHSTIKFLVGISPGGAIIYVSKMYGGRASDKFITKDSEAMLEALEAGDSVMADRGFTIDKELPPGVKLIIPPFKPKDKSQFAKEQLQYSKKIAEARIHVERAMRRIKQFAILGQNVKLAMINNYETIFRTCAYLVNFQDPFLKVVE